MSLLFGYASDLELVEENVDLDGSRILDLPEPTVLVVCDGSEKPSNKRMNDQKRITHPELIAMARERGMKGYQNLRKPVLAERLGIKLPKPTRKEERKPRKARRVKVVNPDGTTTTYPSISKAARALGKYAMQIYKMAAIEGNVRFLKEEDK